VSAVFFSIWWLMQSPPDALPIWSDFSISFKSSSFMSSTSKENDVRRGMFGGSILFAIEDIEHK
jgi:hypothetical protein